MAARTPLFTGYGFFPQQAPADAIMARLMVCSYQVLATVPGFPLEGSRAPPLRRRTVINSNLSLRPGPGEDRRLTWWTFPDKPLVVFPISSGRRSCGPAGSRGETTSFHGNSVAGPPGRVTTPPFPMEMGTLPAGLVTSVPSFQARLSLSAERGCLRKIV